MGLLHFASGASDVSLYGIVRDCSDECALALAVRDVGSKRLSNDFVKLMNSRGAAHLEALAGQGSYAALLVDGRVIKEAASPDKEAVVEGRPFDINVRAVSGGASASNASGLFVNGVNLHRTGAGSTWWNCGRVKSPMWAHFDTNTDAGASQPRR